MHNINKLHGFCKVNIASTIIFALIMLTPGEKAFVEYWKENRLEKKKILRQLSIGLPTATILVITIFANFFSNWYKKADMLRNELAQKYQISLIIVLLIAALLIVVFIVIFSVKHRWDINEQHYRELLTREEKN